MYLKSHRRGVKIGGKKGSIFNGNLHTNNIRPYIDWIFLTHFPQVSEKF
jgi:hypothetical protein